MRRAFPASPRNTAVNLFADFRQEAAGAGPLDGQPPAGLFGQISGGTTRIPPQLISQLGLALPFRSRQRSAGHAGTNTERFQGRGGLGREGTS